MTSDVLPPRCIILAGVESEKQVAEFAATLGGEQTSIRPGDAEQDLEYQVEWEVGPFTLAYAKELDTGLRHVKLYGITESLAELGADLEAMLERDLSGLSLDDLVHDMDYHSDPEDSDPEERCRALIRAGLGAPPRFDERFFTRVCAALRDDDSEVRYGALLGIAYTPWPEYAEPVSQLLEVEPDEDLRHAAEVLTDGFSRAT